MKFTIIDIDTAGIVEVICLSIKFNFTENKNLEFSPIKISFLLKIAFSLLSKLSLLLKDKSTEDSITNGFKIKFDIFSCE